MYIQLYLGARSSGVPLYIGWLYTIILYCVFWKAMGKGLWNVYYEEMINAWENNYVLIWFKYYKMHTCIKTLHGTPPMHTF